MKKSFLFALISFVLVACSNNNDSNSNCNFLLNIGVTVSVNLNLPQYSQLQFAGNSVYIPNVGNNGVIVANFGAGFLAWDASDPNHTSSSCSALEPNGLEGTCGCNDANTYSLVTGESLGTVLPCALKFYPIVENGNTLLITN